MGNDLNKKKIRIYGDGQYLFTTTRHDTIKDAINAFKKGGDISVASIPGYKVNFNDYAKVTGEIVEELKEATDDRDGARYYIFDNSIGAFDDDYEEFDSKKDFLDSLAYNHSVAVDFEDQPDDLEEIKARFDSEDEHSEELNGFLYVKLTKTPLDKFLGEKLDEAKYPGWRHMTSTERRNARMDAIFTGKKDLDNAMKKYLLDLGVEPERVDMLYRGDLLGKELVKLGKNADFFNRYDSETGTLREDKKKFECKKIVKESKDKPVYVITMYEKYPLYASEEGGYYYDGVEIIEQSDVFNSVDEAREALKKWADDEDFEYINFTGDYAADTVEHEYIGEGRFMQIESDDDDEFDDVASRESGRKFYESAERKFNFQKGDLKVGDKVKYGDHISKIFDLEWDDDFGYDVLIRGKDGKKWWVGDNVEKVTKDIKEDTQEDNKLVIKIEAFVRSENTNEGIVSGRIEDKYDDQTLEDWYDFAANVEGIIERDFIVENISLSKRPDSLSEYIDFYRKDDDGNRKEGLVDLRLSDHKSTAGARQNRKRNAQKIDPNYTFVSVVVNEKRFDSYASALKYVEELLGGLNESLQEDTVKTKSGKWVNKGDTGETHGEFKTKKAADAQRKAMFSNKKPGAKWGESLDEGKDANPVLDKINKPLLKKLDEMAQDAYDSDYAQKKFDELYGWQLAALWSLCIYSKENPDGQLYDDEVYDAIAKRRDSEKLFDLSHEIFEKFFTPLGKDESLKEDAKLPNDDEKFLSELARNIETIKSSNAKSSSLDFGLDLTIDGNGYFVEGQVDGFKGNRGLEISVTPDYPPVPISSKYYGIHDDTNANELARKILDDIKKAIKRFQGRNKKVNESMDMDEYVEWLVNIKGWDKDHAVEYAKLFYKEDGTLKEAIEDNIEKETIRTPRGTFELYKGTYKDFKAEEDSEDWGLWFDTYDYPSPDDVELGGTEKWYKVFHNHKNNHAIAVLYKNLK